MSSGALSSCFAGPPPEPDLPPREDLCAVAEAGAAAVSAALGDAHCPPTLGVGTLMLKQARPAELQGSSGFDAR